MVATLTTVVLKDPSQVTIAIIGAVVVFLCFVYELILLAHESDIYTKLKAADKQMNAIAIGKAKLAITNHGKNGIEIQSVYMGFGFLEQLKRTLKMKKIAVWLPYLVANLILCGVAIYHFKSCEPSFMNEKVKQCSLSVLINVEKPKLTDSTN